jgi:protein-S-isoprenylcysteine O-methyltransferase Ste14
MKNIFIPPVFVVLSLILIVLFYFIVPEYNKVPFPQSLAGIVIIFIGFMLMGKTWDLFKKYNTTLDFEKSAHLVKEGVFSKTRNPMYIGMFLLLLGLAICFRNIFSLIVPFGFLLIIQLLFIPKEEKLMLGEFGQEYLDYKKKVRRWV